MARRRTPDTEESIAEQVLDTPETSVLDLLDHILNKGVMATGDLTLGVAGIDLIYVRLSALVCAADRVLPRADRGIPRPSRHRGPAGRLKR